LVSSSHIQTTSYVNDNEIQNQELLTLDTISAIWDKRLASYIISDDYDFILNLNIPQNV